MLPFEPAASIEVKQYNTFRLVGVFKEDDGSQVDLTGCQLTAQIRKANGAKVCDVIITPTGDGFLYFTLPAGTVLPLGTCYLDVFTVLTVAGEVVERNTDIVEIHVKRVVTHA